MIKRILRIIFLGIVALIIIIFFITSRLLSSNEKILKSEFTEQVEVNKIYEFNDVTIYANNRSGENIDITYSLPSGESNTFHFSPGETFNNGRGTISVTNLGYIGKSSSKIKVKIFENK